MQETWETQVLSLDREDSLNKEMATHSNVLPWKIPWTEEPGRLYSPWGCKELDTTERLNTHSTVNQKLHKQLPVSGKFKFCFLERSGLCFCFFYRIFDLQFVGSKDVPPTGVES